MMMMMMMMMMIMIITTVMMLIFKAYFGYAQQIAELNLGPLKKSFGCSFGGI